MVIKMNVKLFDSELKIMEILWDIGDVTAKQIADTLKEKVGWSKTTTYTVIKKCIDKGAVNRTDPNFVCHAVISKEEVQEIETDELINKMYSGSVDMLVASLLGRKKLSEKEIERLKQVVENLK